MAGSTLAIDGFNCVIAVEAALSGGVLLRCRDRATRDLASVHGSYRRVDVTAAALERLVAQIAMHRPKHVVWWLDRPVSNSGRLGAMIEQALEQPNVIKLLEGKAPRKVIAVPNKIVNVVA